MLTMCGKLYIMTGVLPEVIQKRETPERRPLVHF